VIILGIFAYDLLVARHGWCGHLCPMGALYSAIGQYSIVRMRSPKRADCDDCMECFEVCPEPRILPPALKQGMKQGLTAAVLSGLCTNCGRCADICSKDVFAFGLVSPRERTAQTGREGTAKAEDGTVKQAP
jgi:ferredoxin-type protein NapH